MRRLLITTFSNPDYKLGEALRFKKQAIARGFLDVDRMDEIKDLPPELQDKPKQPGIKVAYLKEDKEKTRLFSLWSITFPGGAAWLRFVRDHPKIFSDWLASLYAEPITCWIVGGHHSYRVKGAYPTCWGDERRQTAIERQNHRHNPYVGFGIDPTSNELDWYGSPVGGSLGHVNLPTAHTNLQGIRLLLVLGCNGIPMKKIKGLWREPMAQSWRNWLRSGTRYPLILGWFNQQDMVANDHATHAAEFFWRNLDDLKTALKLGDDAFDVLCDQHALEVANAWGAACYEAYHDSKSYPALWGYGVDKKPFTGGCGAVTPDGGIYHANPAYVPKKGIDPLTKAGSFT